MTKHCLKEREKDKLTLYNYQSVKIKKILFSINKIANP